MKTEEQIKTQKDKLEDQLKKIWDFIEFVDRAEIEYKQLLQWAKCIESGKEALEWALADDSYVDLVY